MPGSKGLPNWMKNSLLPFLVGAVLGTGGLWQFLNARLASRQESVNRAVATTEFRGKLNQALIDIVRKSDRYGRIRDSANWKEHSAANNELRRLKVEIELLKDDFCTLEVTLAALERRPVRPIQVDFIPPAPPRNVRITSLETVGDSVIGTFEWDPGDEGPGPSSAIDQCRGK